MIWHVFMLMKLSNLKGVAMAGGGAHSALLILRPGLRAFFVNGLVMLSMGKDRCFVSQTTGDRFCHQWH